MQINTVYCLKVEGFILTDENIPGKEAVILLDDEEPQKPQVIQIITDDVPSINMVEVTSSSPLLEIQDSDLEQEEMTNTKLIKFDRPGNLIKEEVVDSESVSRVNQLINEIKSTLESVGSQETLEIVEMDLLRIYEYLTNGS